MSDYCKQLPASEPAACLKCGRPAPEPDWRGECNECRAKRAYWTCGECYKRVFRLPGAALPSCRDTQGNPECDKGEGCAYHHCTPF